MVIELVGGMGFNFCTLTSQQGLVRLATDFGKVVFGNLGQNYCFPYFNA